MIEHDFEQDYDTWNTTLNEEFFDNHADEMYEQYISEQYQQLEKENKFVLIYNTSLLKEYIVPGTNIHKIIQIKPDGSKVTSYYKKGHML